MRQLELRTHRARHCRDHRLFDGQQRPDAARGLEATPAPFLGIPINCSTTWSDECGTRGRGSRKFGGRSDPVGHPSRPDIARLGPSRWRHREHPARGAMKAPWGRVTGAIPEQRIGGACRRSGGHATASVGRFGLMSVAKTKKTAPLHSGFEWAGAVARIRRGGGSPRLGRRSALLSVLTAVYANSSRGGRPGGDSRGANDRS